MSRKVKVLPDFEDCDQEWDENPNGNHSIPRSTQTGKVALREVMQGNVVCVDFDDGFHDATENYLKEMAKEHNLTIMVEPHRIVIGPEPKVYVDAVPTDDGVEDLVDENPKKDENPVRVFKTPT